MAATPTQPLRVKNGAITAKRLAAILSIGMVNFAQRLLSAGDRDFAETRPDVKIHA